MRAEIIKYCRADVNILRQSCLKFRECFLNANNVDPLLECITIASACNLVFRRNFLKPETIGIIPQNGYRLADNQSAIAIQWLLWEAHVSGVNIVHSGVGREVRLRENLLVDGFCEETNTVYEFHGCFWHGCERCFVDQTSRLADKRDALFLRRENTIRKEARLKLAGYNVVTMWECDFRKAIERNEELATFVKNDCVTSQLHLKARDSFFGGRTNAAKLYYKCGPGEKIKYYDVCSLYPFVNKYGKYPVGHPKIHVGPEVCSRLDIETIEGLVKCTVLPPQDLYHPVLPYRCNGRLTFPLCRTCVEGCSQTECDHEPEDRQLTGTYVADELRKAVEKKYIIISIHEVWEYDVVQYDPTTKPGGLFSGYINNFLKIKQECSGWPSWCVTQDDRDRYIQGYYDREGVKFEPAKIAKNPGLRFVSKIMLNSFWRKFGQKENASQTQIISQPADLFKLVMNPAIVVDNVTILNDEGVLTSWERVEEDISPLKTVNVVVAAYTTAMARLELYKHLEQLGERVLYYDTDSVIFVSSENDWEPPVGDFLGDLTDEMVDYGAGSHITEFVSAGPKNYAYKFWCDGAGKFDTVCKVKGVTLHYENSGKVNFETIKSIVLEDPHRHIDLIDNRIVRNQRYDVLTKHGAKRYTLQYTKRRRLDERYDTVPYGFKAQL
jgi:G:T-mismatch repair DNA endonuclease (very short patch repair protein)